MGRAASRGKSPTTEKRVMPENKVKQNSTSERTKVALNSPAHLGRCQPSREPLKLHTHKDGAATSRGNIMLFPTFEWPHKRGSPAFLPSVTQKYDLLKVPLAVSCKTWMTDYERKLKICLLPQTLEGKAGGHFMEGLRTPTSSRLIAQEQKLPESNWYVCPRNRMRLFTRSVKRPYPGNPNIVAPPSCEIKLE